MNFPIDPFKGFPSGCLSKSQQINKCVLSGEVALGSRSWDRPGGRPEQGKTIQLEYTIYNIHLYNIQYTLYNIQYTIYNTQYTLYIHKSSMHARPKMEAGSLGRAPGPKGPCAGPWAPGRHATKYLRKQLFIRMLSAWGRGLGGDSHFVVFCYVFCCSVVFAKSANGPIHPSKISIGAPLGEVLQLASLF